MPENKSKLPPDKEAFLREAVKFLENPNLLMKLTDMIGKPLEKVQKVLPHQAQAAIHAATSKALTKALDVAVSTGSSPSSNFDWGQTQTNIRSRSLGHMAATAATGAIGGFFGVAGLAVELPISTTIMLRSIAEVAQSYGVDLSKQENRLECLYVFTLGSKGKFDDAMDSSYLSSRLAFAQYIRAAIKTGTAPALMRFISRVAVYFEVAVTEKVMAEAVPVIGALGGAAINAGFTSFFSDAAKFHFGMKALENEYGEDVVREEYQRILKAMKP